ncbi:MAG: prepilin-type N-terminal cleavage/methylation domain-containing protein [Candidatus Omnitrophota bacterium]
MKQHSSRGFTLVEILIVVAIIVVISAIAIPNLISARINANEASALASLKALTSAAEAFRMSQVPVRFPDNLAELNATEPPFIDAVLATGNKSGYAFNWTGGTNTYSVLASPQAPNATGVRNFFLDQSGVIRVGNSSSGTPIE